MLEQLSFAVVEDVGSSYNEDNNDETARNWYPQGKPRRKARYTLWEL
jgi:hypothetical protein